jgi:hypothetical protein
MSGFVTPRSNSTGRTASYVIAASDAPAIWKAQADAVCDGTADDVQINAAYTAGYKDIDLSPGLFSISSAITPTAISALQGQGIGITTVQLAGSVNMFTLASKDWVQISDMTLDGNTKAATARGIDATTSHYLRLNNVYFTQFRDWAILNTNSWDWKVSWCVFCDTGLSTLGAVKTINADALIPSDIYFDHCRWEGIDGYHVYAVNSEYIRFTSCKLHGWSTDGSRNDAPHIMLEGSSKARITDCQFLYAKVSFIELRFSGTHDIIVKGCDFYDSNGYGLVLGECNHVQIHNNYFRDITTQCVSLHATVSTYIDILDNTVYDTSPFFVDWGYASSVTFRNNKNWIAHGEIRTYSGTISTLTENAFNSLDNPFGQTVRVLSEDIYVSTKATSTEPNIDCGIGSSATTDYTTLFDDLPGETVGFYKSTVATPGAQTVPQLWASGSGNRYLNHSIKGAAATGMVATYVITVMGI